MRSAGFPWIAAVAAIAVASCAGLRLPSMDGATKADAPAAAPEAKEPAVAPSLEKQALAHLDRMRAIKPATDPRQAEQYNRVLEDAWKFFIANPDVIVVLRRSLAREISLPVRNDFILLDLGYYLQQRGTPADKDLARSALFTLDPGAEIIRFNLQELFQLTQAVAAGRDPRILAFIDKAFLRREVAVPIPEAKLTLDPATACALLYGAYGDGAEVHLKASLKMPLADRALARKILEILAWIGSPSSNAEVKGVLMGASHDYDTFVRTATVLMTVGGPPGRAVVLAVRAEDLDPWTRNYYERILGSARAATFLALRAPLAQQATAKAILDSAEPRAKLIDDLMRTRTKLFGSVSADGLAEIRRVNAILNALRYRDT